MLSHRECEVAIKQHATYLMLHARHFQRTIESARETSKRAINTKQSPRASDHPKCQIMIWPLIRKARRQGVRFESQSASRSRTHPLELEEQSVRPIQFLSCSI